VRLFRGDLGLEKFTRKFERCSFACTTEVLFDNKYFECLSEDISLNGLSTLTEHRLPVGKAASLLLYLPNTNKGQPIRIESTVARNKSNGLAFKFKSFDQEAFTLLVSAAKLGTVSSSDCHAQLVAWGFRTKSATHYD
jgi:hypothetical protein